MEKEGAVLVQSFFVNPQELPGLLKKFEVLKSLHHPYLCPYTQLIEVFYFNAILTNRENKIESLYSVNITIDLFDPSWKSAKKRQEEELSTIAFQLGEALAYLASVSLSPRCLPLEHILWSAQGIRLSGYGESYLAQHATYVSGIPDLLPPEALVKNRSTPMGTIWALGLVLWELSTLSPLLPSSSVPSATFLELLRLCGYVSSPSPPSSPSLSSTSPLSSAKSSLKGTTSSPRGSGRNGRGKGSKSVVSVLQHQHSLDSSLRQLLSHFSPLSLEWESLLLLCFTVDPKERMDPSQFLTHPYFMGKMRPTGTSWVPKPALQSWRMKFPEDLPEGVFLPLLEETLLSLEGNAPDFGIFYDLSDEDSEKLLLNCSSESFLIRKTSLPELGESSSTLLLSSVTPMGPTVTHRRIGRTLEGFVVEGSLAVFPSLVCLSRRFPGRFVFPSSPTNSSPLSLSSDNFYSSPVPPSPAPGPLSHKKENSSQFSENKWWENSAAGDRENFLYKTLPSLRPSPPILRLPKIVRLEDSLSLENSLPALQYSLLDPFWDAPPRGQSDQIPRLPEYYERELLPSALRECDVPYQRHRIRLFHSLLSRYPATRETIIAEAKRDIPPLLRGEIWAAILGVPENPQEVYDQFDKELEGPIELDIPRCHQYHPLLASPEGHQKMRRLLKSWVTANDGRLVYWQVLAPFLALLFHDEAKVFCCLEAFVEKHMYQYYTADNHMYLEGQLSVMGKLLTYHDPKLALHLAQISFRPDLFAISCAEDLLPIEKTYRVWDAVLVGPSSLVYFLAVAFLRALRTELLPLDFNATVLLFSSMPPIQVSNCLDEAVRLFQATPIDCDKVNEGDVANLPLGEQRTGRKERKEEMFLRSSPKDVLSAQSMGGVVLDTRSAEEFQRCHFVDSLHFPFREFDKDISLGDLEGLQGKPIAVVGPSAVPLALKLIHSLFPYVSVVSGGFQALKDHCQELLKTSS